MNIRKEVMKNMANKERESFLIGRNAVTGRLMTVADARQRPATTTVERMPLPGKGTAKK
jgi:hypothetical protein